MNNIKKLKERALGEEVAEWFEKIKLSYNTAKPRQLEVPAHLTTFLNIHCDINDIPVFVIKPGLFLLARTYRNLHEEVAKKWK